MASRTKVQSVEIDGTDLVALFVTVVEFSPTEESPVTVQELDDETGQSTFDALNILADAELIGFERGNVWVAIPDVSETNAQQTAYDALMTHPLPPAEAPKPKRATKAKAPIVPSPQLDEIYTLTENSEIVETVTIPRMVEAKEAGKIMDEIVEKLLDAEFPETWTPTFEGSKITEDFEAPETLPAVPAGVSENTWFMVHCANTESARAWWMAKADAQINAHKLNQPEVAPF